MNLHRAEDIKDIALKLDKIRMCRPEDYFYLKGWIHCLLRKENEKSRQPRKPSKQITQSRKKDIVQERQSKSEV